MEKSYRHNLSSNFFQSNTKFPLNFIRDAKSLLKRILGLDWQVVAGGAI